MFKIQSMITRFRTLQFKILTLFLSLSIFSFGFIIVISYRTNYSSLHKHANELIGIASTSILENVSGLFTQAQRIVDTSAGLFSDIGEISNNNAYLSAFLLEMIRYRPGIPFFYIGTETGDFLEASRISLTRVNHYLSDPTKSLPAHAAYTLAFTKRSATDIAQTIRYFDAKLQLVAEESVPNPLYDPRNRPWYQGVVKNCASYWTDIYQFATIPEAGITVANPVFSKQGNLIGVVGMDLSLSVLSQFFLHQHLGMHGQAFLLEQSGRILMPSEIAFGKIQPDYQRVLEQARVSFLSNHESNQTLQTDKNRYLAYVNNFPLHNHPDWLIGIIVPYEDFFGELSRSQRILFLIMIGVAALSSIIILYFAKNISSPITKLAGEINQLCRFDLVESPPLHSKIHEIDVMETSIQAMRKAMRSFGVYVPKELVRHIMHNRQDIALGGEKKEITIFFSDIAGFSALFEKYPTDFVLQLITEYFDGLSKIILAAHGTIDKYIGDSIMAFWGAPDLLLKHADQACIAALLCKQFVDRLNAKRRQEQKPEFPTRFGLSSGTAIVGNIGTPERMNYTVLGDSVNIAARLQTMNKMFHTSILISEGVVSRLGDRFLIRPLGLIQLAGKDKNVNVYELMACLSGSDSIKASQAQLDLCRAFTEGYNAYTAGDFAQAGKLFRQILERFPQDYPTQLFLQKIDVR